MTTRKPKPAFLYAIEAPSKWLRVALCGEDQDPTALCRKAWQCQLPPLPEPMRMPRRAGSH